MNLKPISPTFLRLLLTATLMLVSSAVQAQYFLDDFEDGSATDGSPVTWTRYPAPYDMGDFTVTNGDLVVTPPNVGPGPLPGNPNYRELDLVADGRLFHDVNVLARVRALADGPSVVGFNLLDTYFTDSQVGQSIYSFLVFDGTRRYLQTSIALNQTSAPWAIAPTTISHFTDDVYLRFVISGDQAKFTIWPDGSPEPSVPQLMTTLPAVMKNTLGRVVVFAGHTQPTVPVAFRFVSVVPEPSTATLVGCAAATVMFWSRRRHRLTGYAVLLIALTTMTPAAQAQSVLIDDFNDGNDQGWNRIDFNSNPVWGKGTFDASSGAYRIVSESPVPTGQRGALLSLWGDSAQPQYVDGFVRARMSVSTNSLPWLVMRASPTASSFYLFGIDPSGEPPVFFYSEINNYTVVADGGFNIPGESVEIGEEWIVEAGAVGNALSMKVWKPGQPEPAAPQWTRIDGTLAAGAFGVGASHFAPQPPAVVSASFDDVYFRIVPEPSSLMLTGLALATVLFGPLRRKRRAAIA